MKIKIRDIIEANPCQGGLEMLYKVFNINEYSKGYIDTNEVDDRLLNKLDLSFGINNNLIKIESYYNYTSNYINYIKGEFTESPFGGIRKFFRKSNEESPVFRDGKLTAVVYWEEIPQKEADYFTMVLTNMDEWCFYPVWQESLMDDIEEIIQDRLIYKARY